MLLQEERNTSVMFKGDASPPLYSTLRYYYVMRWRREEEEEVHFLATHDKQITFERLIPRHYSPWRTLLPLFPFPVPPFMGASDTSADQGWNFNEIFSISRPILSKKSTIRTSVLALG